MNEGGGATPIKKWVQMCCGSFSGIGQATRIFMNLETHNPGKYILVRKVITNNIDKLIFSLDGRNKDINLLICEKTDP